MASRRFLLFILPLIWLAINSSFFIPAIAGSVDVVLEACKKVDRRNQDYCVNALSSAPKIRKAANIASVAAAALKLAAKNATATSQFVDMLYRNNVDDSLLDCVIVCKEDYLDAAEHLSDAEVAMGKRKYKKVLRYLEAAMAFVKYCKDACKSVPKAENPLVKRNKDARILCNITMALVKQLVRS